MAQDSAIKRQFNKDAKKYGTEAVEVLGVFLMLTDSQAMKEKLDRFFEKLHTFKGILLMLPDTRKLGEKLHSLEATLATKSLSESLLTKNQWGREAITVLRNVISDVERYSDQTTNLTTSQSQGGFEFSLPKEKTFYVQEENILAVLPYENLLFASFVKKEGGKSSYFLFKGQWVSCKKTSLAKTVVVYRKNGEILAKACINSGTFIKNQIKQAS